MIEVKNELKKKIISRYTCIMNSFSVIIYIIVHTYHMKIRKFVKANYFTIFSIGRIVYVHFSKNWHSEGNPWHRDTTSLLRPGASTSFAEWITHTTYLAGWDEYQWLVYWEHQYSLILLHTAVPIWNAEEGTQFLGQGTAPSISF